MPFSRRFCRTLPGVAAAFAVSAALTAYAAPATNDPDFEAVAPPVHASALTSAQRHSPVSLIGSPLAVPDDAAGPPTRMRFQMRDGETLVAQVLAFDGQMYALRLPHATLLARKDLFVSIKPVSARSSSHARSVHAQ